MNRGDRMFVVPRFIGAGNDRMNAVTTSDLRKHPLRRPTAPRAGGPDAKDRAASGANFAGPTQGGGCLALGGVLARIAWIDCKVGEEVQPAPQRAQHRVLRQEWRKETLEFVGLFHVDAEFFQQCLQVLLGRLLAMEANLIVQGLTTPREHCGGPVIVFGFGHPFARASFHRGACL